MSRTRVEWIKRLVVLPVLVLAALALREWAAALGLSRWIVTVIAPFLYVLCFALADLAWNPSRHDRRPPSAYRRTSGPL